MSETVARTILRALLAALDQQAEVRLPFAAPEELVMAVARRHRLSPLLSVLNPSGLSAAATDQFRRDRVVTVARNMFLADALSECTGALAEASIPVIVLKGLAYEQSIYAAAGLRPTGDIDILVPPDARRAAFRVLSRLGFEPRAAAPGFDDAAYHEVAWKRKEVEVDLHLALAPLVRCRIDYSDVWARARRPATPSQTEMLVLDPLHAAVFHALHMAIDHFEVPALYLVDFTRLLPEADDVVRAESVARGWRCHRSFVTTLALVAEFLPAWRAKQPARPVPWVSRRLVERYGAIEGISRPEQMLRKFAHLDGPGYALRYVITQGRRNVHELIERRIRKRSARARLSLDRDA